MRNFVTLTIPVYIYTYGQVDVKTGVVITREKQIYTKKPRRHTGRISPNTGKWLPLLEIEQDTRSYVMPNNVFIKTAYNWMLKHDQRPPSFDIAKSANLLERPRECIPVLSMTGAELQYEIEEAAGRNETHKKEINVL